MGLQSLDTMILDFINQNLHNAFLDILMPLVSTLGNHGVLWITIGLVLTISKKHRTVGILLLLSLVLTYVLGDVILKGTIQRLRPCAELPATAMLIDKPLSYSFPSGHTSIAFASARMLAEYFKEYKIIFYLSALIMGFSRLYLHVHYPTDVICGALLGVICSKVVIYLYEKRKEKRLSENLV